ncbi:unnamed protein product [Closterium sp. NIES-54]
MPLGLLHSKSGCPPRTSSMYACSSVYSPPSAHPSIVTPHSFSQSTRAVTVTGCGCGTSVSQIDPLPGAVSVEVASDSGAARGAASGGVGPWGAEPGGAESEGAGSGGAEPGGAELEGAEPAGVATGGCCFWLVQRARLRSGDARAGATGDTRDTGARGAGVTTGASGAGGAAATRPEGARTKGTRAAGTGGVGGAGGGDPTEHGAAGTGGVGAGGAGAGGTGAGGTGSGGAGARGARAGGARAGGTGAEVGAVDPRAGGARAGGIGASPLPAPSPYSGQTGGLTKRREPASRPASPVCTGRRVPHPPPVSDTHAMALHPSSVPLCVPLPAPPESALLAIPDPESDHVHAASPTVSRLLTTVVTDPSFKSTAVSALVAELLEFAAACRPDYTTALVAEFESAGPPSVGGECALGTDFLEDRQEEFECLAAAVPRFASMLLAPEGDPDAPDIPTPRSYAEEITGPYSSQWQTAMDAEMGEAVPGSPPAFKARYVARGFSRRKGVNNFQTFSPTPKMTTLRVLLHVAAQRDYELHSLDFSTTFLQGSLHEEIWLRRPPGFTGLFPAGTQWSLWRPVYSLRQAPRKWHDTLRTTLAALGFTPSTADPSLFLRTDTSLPPFYVLVTSSIGLVLGGRGPVVLTGHADASWVFLLGPAPSGVSQVDAVEPLEVAVDSGTARGAEPVGAGSGGAEPGGAEPGGAESGGAESGGAELGGAEPGGAESGGAEPGGAEPGGAESARVASRSASSRRELLSPQELRDWFARRWSRAAGAGGPPVAPGPGGARTGGTGAVGTGGAAAAVGVGPAGASGAAGAGAAGSVGAGVGAAGASGAAGVGSVGGVGAGVGLVGGTAGAVGGTGVAGPAGVGAVGAGGAAGTGAATGGTGAVLVGTGGPVRPRPYFVPLLEQVLGLPPSPSPAPPLECPQPVQSQSPLQPVSPLPAPSPYAGATGGLVERREPASRPASPVRTTRTSRRAPRPRPPAVPGTHQMTLRPSTAPLRVPLPSPPASSLPVLADPASDSLLAASPTVARLLSTVVTGPSFESTAASALVAELVDFAARCRLDYAASLVADSASVCPPSVGGECALSTDVLEDKQEEFQCFAATLPHLVSTLIAPEGDPDAPNIPTPRSYAEAIEGPYSSQWQSAMDAEMASWKSTGTYVDEVPPLYPVSSSFCDLEEDEQEFLQARFSCEWGLPASCLYLGLQITRDRAQCTITLTQSHMVQQVLQRFDFTYSSPQATPLSTRHSLSALPSDESVEPSGLYPELVGCLMYLMTYTRPDLAYPLSILARYVAPGRHGPEHMAAAKRVLRYLCSTSGLGLVLGGRRPVVLTGHADASWADDQATQRSSQGYTFSLGSGSISWRSTRSSSVLGSSCEAEIYAGAMAAQELRWFTYLLADLGEPPRSPPVLYVDYKAMLALCREHKLEHRTKHIALHYFFARELQQRGQLRLPYVAS